MQHTIPILSMHGPLPIPHLFQWPEYCRKRQYMAIIPNDMAIQEGDTFFKGSGIALGITKIVERRPAKGDWSKQPIHKKPDFIRFLAY